MSNCIWKQDGVGEEAWDTTCQNRFSLSDGTPSENYMKFCCYCGGVLMEQVAEEEEGDE